MNSILLTVALVGAIGLAGSTVLVFASKKLAVQEDERLADVIVDVAVDRAPLRLDAALPPALERASHVDADRLAEDGGVDLLLVVGEGGAHARGF